MRTRAVVTDIEGTTTPIAFVRDTLFPYARARLPAFLAEQGGTPLVAPLLRAVEDLAPGRTALSALLAWMDVDAKIPPLKALQGMIWNEGYASGALRGALYPDVAPALRRLHEAGVKLYVYSSGSVEAQRLIFAHSVAGDLSPLFEGFFDTAIGGKREAGSYRAIAARLALPPHSVLFLSDVAEELAAAEDSGLRCCQIVRRQDETIPDRHFAQAESFDSLPT